MIGLLILAREIIRGAHARAGTGALASADFEEEMRDDEGVIGPSRTGSSTRGGCAPQNADDASPVVII
jgi:hypothetical protein